MLRMVVAVCIVAGFGAYLTAQFFAVEENLQAVGGAKINAAKTERASPGRRVSSSGYYSREVRIAAASNRQYYTRASVNRRDLEFLVDTGAVAVALRESDAARAGVRVRRDDYNVPISTANGRTYGARVMLDEVSLDGLRVRDVDAIILPDNSLTINLLGMSYLSQLEKVETRNGEMILQ